MSTFNVSAIFFSAAMRPPDADLVLAVEYPLHDLGRDELAMPAAISAATVRSFAAAGAGRAGQRRQALGLARKVDHLRLDFATNMLSIAIRY